MASTDITPRRGRGSLLSPFSDPFMRDPFGTLRGGIDRMIADAFDGSSFPGFGSGEESFAAPSLDIAETDGAIEITADLPGVDPSKIEVTVENGTLTISGTREHEEKEDDEARNFHRIERFRGRFVRRVALPAGIDEEAVSANHDKGVLTIRVPKTDTAEANGRRIEVKSA